MKKAELAAFLDMLQVGSLEEYLARHGPDPSIAMAGRLMWAAQNFRDPSCSGEAEFLMAHHVAILAAVKRGEGQRPIDADSQDSIPTKLPKATPALGGGSVAPKDLRSRSPKPRRSEAMLGEEGLGVHNTLMPDIDGFPDDRRRAPGSARKSAGMTITPDIGLMGDDDEPLPPPNWGDAPAEPEASQAQDAAEVEDAAEAQDAAEAPDVAEAVDAAEAGSPAEDAPATPARGPAPFRDDTTLIPAEPPGMAFAEPNSDEVVRPPSSSEAATYLLADDDAATPRDPPAHAASSGSAGMGSPAAETVLSTNRMAYTGGGLHPAVPAAEPPASEAATRPPSEADTLLQGLIYNPPAEMAEAAPPQRNLLPVIVGAVGLLLGASALVVAVVLLGNRDTAPVEAEHIDSRPEISGSLVVEDGTDAVASADSVPPTGSAPETPPSPPETTGTSSPRVETASAIATPPPSTTGTASDAAPTVSRPAVSTPTAEPLTGTTTGREATTDPPAGSEASEPAPAPEPPAPPPAWTGPDLLGTWAGTDGTGALTVEVTGQDGASFWGRVTLGVGGVPTTHPMSGTVDAEAGTLSFRQTGGEMAFSGTIQGTTARGTWSFAAGGSARQWFVVKK